MTTSLAKLTAAALVLGAPVLLDAQPSAPPGRGAMMDVPFSAGERLTYDVKFGPMKVGSGTMEVAGITTVRGRQAWHTTFRVRGGTFFYKVNDLLESWIDTRTFESLRFVQDFQEGRRNRERRYEIFPERATYLEEGKTEQPSVKDPLDDGSFLYFIRTVPLEVGQTYEFNRYFRPDRNPVKIVVLRKERVNVPGGTFDAIVIRPVIKTKGIFSENGEAELWLSDDDRRIMVQMKSKLSFGSLNLYLRSYTPGTKTTAGTPAAVTALDSTRDTTPKSTPDSTPR